MTRSRLLLFALLGTALAASAAGCSGAGEPGAPVAETCFDAQGRSYSPCRVFKGRLQLPHPARLRTEVGPFQVGALAFEAKGGAGKPDAGAAGDGGAGATKPTSKVAWRFFAGEPFAHDAGVGERSSVPFSVTVPCGLSVNLLLQLPRDGGEQPGTQVAQMAFAASGSGSSTTTLVPYQPASMCGAKTAVNDLETVVLTLAQAQVVTSGSITLGKKSSKNPLALLDTDGDATADLSDADDDDDGTADAADTDGDGDGIVDTAQTFSALPDRDKDGTPDLFE